MADREKQVAERQAGDYAPPILAEPDKKRPVPPWQPEKPEGS